MLQSLHIFQVLAKPNEIMSRSCVDSLVVEEGFTER